MNANDVCQVDSPVSLENTESKASRLIYMTKKTDDDYQWIHEVNQFCPGVKVILIGKWKRFMPERGEENEYPCETLTMRTVQRSSAISGRTLG